MDSRKGVLEGVWTGGGGADLVSPVTYSVVDSVVVTVVVTVVVVADFDRCITAAADAPLLNATASLPMEFPGSGGSGGRCFGVVACAFPPL